MLTDSFAAATFCILVLTEEHQQGGFIEGSANLRETLRRISQLWDNVRTHLKLGELSSLFVFSNITISSVYPLKGF